MTDLLDLAARVEAAEGPDRELDIEIWRACIASVSHLELIEVGGAAHGPSEAEFRTLRLMDGKQYTASLDAAMTLAGSEAVAVLLDAINACREDSVSEWVKALPRFVCAAALRARAADEGLSHD